MKRSSRKGFTLVELLVAVAIVAFAVCGILSLYVACFGLTKTSRNMSIATNAAQALMEQIRSSDFNSIVDTYDGMTFTVNSIPNSKGVVYVNDTIDAVLGTNPDLLKVTISVCWKQGSVVIGEDKNLNGVLNAGEDTAPFNGIIDSPVEIVTQIANR